jgi:3-deoxy-D-arabino-heptulosonate 7-phosphate (DAHP) synthase class II
MTGQWWCPALPRRNERSAWHRALGSRLTGEDVTECTGGGLEEEDLDKNYVSVCDPRLTYRQALEMGFGLARLLAPRA